MVLSDVRKCAQELIGKSGFRCVEMARNQKQMRQRDMRKVAMFLHLLLGAIIGVPFMLFFMWAATAAEDFRDFVEAPGDK